MIKLSSVDTHRAVLVLSEPRHPLTSFVIELMSRDAILVTILALREMGVKTSSHLPKGISKAKLEEAKLAASEFARCVYGRRHQVESCLPWR